MDSKFNLYDFVVYVVPGISMLAAASAVIWIATDSCPWRGLEFSVAEGVIFLVACYIVGHLVQAMRFRLFNPNRFTSTAGGLVARLRSAFPNCVAAILALESPNAFADSLRSPNSDSDLIVRQLNPGEKPKRFDLPDSLKLKLRERLAKDFGVNLDEDRGPQVAWTLARLHLVSIGSAGLCEVYNSLGTMCVNLAVVFRCCAACAWIACVCRVTSRFAQFGELRPDLGGLGGVLIGVFAYAFSIAMQRQSRSLLGTYGRSVFLTYYAKFSGEASAGRATGGDAASDAACPD